MSIELRLEDPSVGSNLLDFFHRNGLRAVLDGDRVIVEVRDHAPERHLSEVTLLVQIWRIVNPECTVTIETPEHGD